METIIPQVEAIQNNIDLADARADLEAFINVGCVFSCNAINVSCSLLHYAQRINPFKLNPGQTVDIAHRCCQDFEDLRHEIEEFKTKFDDFANFISGGDLDRAIEQYVESLAACSIGGDLLLAKLCSLDYTSTHRPSCDGCYRGRWPTRFMVCRRRHSYSVGCGTPFSRTL